MARLGHRPSRASRGSKKTRRRVKQQPCVKRDLLKQDQSSSADTQRGPIIVSRNSRNRSLTPDAQSVSSWKRSVPRLVKQPRDGNHVHVEMST